MQVRPDIVLIVKHLMLFATEAKRQDVGILGALSDLRAKFAGLEPTHYGSLPYLLAAAQSGHQVQLCAVGPSGQV